jgi:hydrogenase-1 operon protein HyaF
MFRAFLMQKLQDIAVTVAPPERPDNHANALPILHEILYALQRFAHQGETKCIDLHAIPFGPGDEQALLLQLGRGEISLTLDSLGKSNVWETGYSGVWIIDHRNATGERIALQIEIGRIPQIVLAQHEDIFDAIEQLEKQLKNQ